MGRLRDARIQIVTRFRCYFAAACFQYWLTRHGGLPALCFEELDHQSSEYVESLEWRDNSLRANTAGLNSVDVVLLTAFDRFLRTNKAVSLQPWQFLCEAWGYRQYRL